MRTIYFVNKEPIDLGAIAIMGVSVKEGSNPIGYFGTGLKFALATLLRTGHEVRLTLRRPPPVIGGIEYPQEVTNIEFKAQPEVIRGETFQRVRMEFNGGSAYDLLGFTTALGRNWEPWMAYRELRSNAMDEGGVVSDTLPEGEWGTVFAVTGDALATCHERRHETFLETAPLARHPELDIHEGPSGVAFYRTVRAHQLEQQSILTYNLRADAQLTEDRTLKNAWELTYHLQKVVQDLEDEPLLDTILTAPKGSLEAGLGFHYDRGRPGPAFMRFVERNRRSSHLNLGALKLWEKNTDVKLAYDEAILDDHEEAVCREAVRLVQRIAPECQRYHFLVMDGMGDVYGLCRFGHIYLARRTLDRGARFTASTLYEEWLHKTEKAEDCSRSLQDHLLDKLFMLVERMPDRGAGS